MKTLFTAIRKLTVWILIASVVILVFFAILSIWDVLDGDALEKSMFSMGIITFSSIMVIIASFIGEGKNLIGKHGEKKMPIGRIIFWTAVALVVMGFLKNFFWYVF